MHIPGPDEAGREAILRIHTQRMHEAGRIDTPPPDANKNGGGGGGDGGDGAGADGYDSLVSSLAAVTDGFTGAELAGLVRAAASYALERAVGSAGESEAAGCRVTAEDFGRGLADVTRSKSSAGKSASGGAGDEAAAAAAAAAAAMEEEEEGRASTDDVSSVGSAAAAGGGPRESGEKEAASPRQVTPGAVSKPSVSAYTVEAARAEGGIGGKLSAQVRGVCCLRGQGSERDTLCMLNRCDLHASLAFPKSPSLSCLYSTG